MEWKNKQKRRWGLQARMALALLLLSAALIGVSLGFYYNSVQDMVFDAHVEKGEIATTLAAEHVTGEDIQRFVAQGFVDEAFLQERDAYFRSIKKEFRIQYFYLFIPKEDHLVYLYSAVNAGDDVYSKVQFGQVDQYLDKRLIEKVVKSGKVERSLDINSDEKYGYLASVYAPVMDADGKVAAIFAADFSMNALVAEIRSDVVRAATWIALTVLILLALYSYVIHRRMILPLQQLTASVQNFVVQCDGSATEQKLDLAPVRITADNELRDLAEACSAMAQDIKTYVGNLQEVTAAKQAIETELNVAKNIQEMLLPHIFPPFTKDDHFSIFATIEPAKSVGGDYYDFYRIDDDHVCFTIADVSGKGVPAALFMVIAKTIMKNQAASKLCPDQILAGANNQLNEDNEEGMFVTAFIGILELSTGRLAYSNAGHNPPVLLRQNGEIAFLPVDKNIVLAVMDDMEFTLQETVLAEGDVLFLYTDGVTEAMNSRQEQYTEARLLACLGELRGEGNLAALLRGVRASLSVHVDGAEQSDDITMMAVRLDGRGE